MIKNRFVDWWQNEGDFRYRNSRGDPSLRQQNPISRAHLSFKGNNGHKYQRKKKTNPFFANNFKRKEGDLGKTNIH